MASFRNNARSRKIASKCPHNVAQARGPKIRPKLEASCRRLVEELDLGDCYSAVGNSCGCFGQTCLFTIFPNISTTIRGSEFNEIREKAGLSKTRMSCRRLRLLEKVLKTTVRNVFRFSKIFVWPSPLQCGEQRLRNFKARYLRSLSEYV